MPAEPGGKAKIKVTAAATPPVEAVADPAPAPVPVTWEDIQERAKLALADESVPPPKRVERAGELVARGIPEELTKPGVTFQLGEGVFTWGLKKQGFNGGYFGLFTTEATVRLYRVMTFPTADTGLTEADDGKGGKKFEGGNQFVLIDKWTSPVVW